MRKKIVAGNWKMNLHFGEALDLAEDVSAGIPANKDIRVIIAPSFPLLYPVTSIAEISDRLEIAAQNMHHKPSGAYTGEVSARMLKSIGINTVILGHSERRNYFGETDDILAEKVSLAMEEEMNVIFCIGEQLDDRQNWDHFTVVGEQLEAGLFHLSGEAWKRIVIAYEPVWAIGTGETATPSQAQEMHAYIRSRISKHYGETIADNTPILYGGSVKPSNAGDLFSQPDIDGGLIGGASLRADDFIHIMETI